MIHTTVGVYPDGSYKINGVKSEHIATHIEYNLKFRPGRALIVDGVVISHGMSVDPYEINKILENWEIYKTNKDTAPYV